MKLDERLSVGAYLKISNRTVDGGVWLLICFVTVICIADLLFKTNLIPLREATRPGKALVLLFFTPFLSFLVLVLLRQLPFSQISFCVLMRPGICSSLFLVLNF